MWPDHVYSKNAVHEAAHALMAFRRGFPIVTEVTTFEGKMRDGTKYEAACFFEPIVLENLTRDQRISMAMFYAAGPIADALFGKDLPPVQGTDNEDTKQIAELLRSSVKPEEVPAAVDGLLAGVRKVLVFDEEVLADIVRVMAINRRVSASVIESVIKAADERPPVEPITDEDLSLQRMAWATYSPIPSITAQVIREETAYLADLYALRG